MTIDEVPENVRVGLNYAAALWPHDPTITTDATVSAWADPLSPFSVDELCAAFDALGRSEPKMPSLAEVIAEVRNQQRKAELAARPLLDPPSPRTPTLRRPITGPDTEYRARLRKDMLKFLRRSDGTVDPVKLAEAQEWIDEVGPIESGFAAKYHDVDLPVTQPQRGGGNMGAAFAAAVAPVVDALDDPPEQRAAAWLAAWKAAAGDPIARDQLRAQADLFSPEMKQAVRDLNTPAVTS